MKRRIGLALTMITALSLLTACGRFAQAGASPVAASAAEAETVEAQEAAEPEKETTVPETTEEKNVTKTEKSTVTVTSDHGVSVVPDTAEIAFGVQTQAATAKKAQEDNAKAVDQVIEALLKAGVEEKDIRTTGVDMYPRYDNFGEKITGYNMYTHMTVSNQSLEKAGELVNLCVEAGANQMNGLSYTYSGYDEAYAEALGNATKAAEGKAKAIAEAAGKTLGEIAHIEEGYQDTSLRRSYQDMGMYAAKEEAAAMDSLAILPGEVNVRAAVTVTYYVE